MLTTTIDYQEIAAILLEKKRKLTETLENLRSSHRDLSAQIEGETGIDRSNTIIQKDNVIQAISRNEDMGVEIDNALIRIERDIYGICEKTKNRIPFEVLRAHPTIRVYDPSTTGPKGTPAKPVAQQIPVNPPPKKQTKKPRWR